MKMMAQLQPKMMMTSALVVFVAMAFLNYADAQAAWSYEGTTGPASWVTNYPECGRKYQSPINIDHIHRDRGHRPSYYNYGTLPLTMTLANDGKTLKLTSTHTAGVKPYLKIKTTSGKERSYELSSVHFHWGKTDSEGSEHTVKGVRYPMEMHAVHYRLTEGSLDTSQAVILAYFFNLVSTDNAALNKVLTNIATVKNPSTTATTTPFAWNELLIEFRTHFYLYKGSLSEPPCSQIANYFIRKTPLDISAAQLAKFRTLLNAANTDMSGNFRPIQPRNKRHVYFID